MRTRPKTFRRLLLAGAGLLVIGLAVPAMMFVRSWQNARRTERLRAEGMTAYQRADFPAAIDGLSAFLRRSPNDREALLAFADARTRVEEPDGKHLAQAVPAYRRLWSLDSHDRPVAKSLLGLYIQLGYFAEARDLALSLRPADLAAATAEDLPVLLDEASTRLELAPTDPKLEDLMRALRRLAPMNYRVALLSASILSATGRNAEVLTYASEVAAATPATPQTRFAAVVMRTTAGDQADREELVGVFSRCAGLDRDRPIRTEPPGYDEPDFAFRLAAAFDRLGKHDHALAVLRDCAVRLKDPYARRIAVRRQWQSGLSADLLADNPWPGQAPGADPSEIVGFQSLALRARGSAAEADAAAALLRSRPRDRFAEGWAEALRVDPSAKDPAPELEKIDRALTTLPNEPVFHYFRAEILNSLGRAEDARRVWSSIPNSPLAMGWARPAVRCVESLLDERRVEEAGRAAQAALAVNRDSADALLANLRVTIESIELGYPVANPAETLKDLDLRAETLGAVAVSESSRTISRLLLPGRVLLRVTTGSPDKARELILAALATPGLVDEPLARRLALASSRTGLGLEEKILSSAGVPPGAAAAAETPDSIVDRALLLRGVDASQAVKEIDRAVAMAPEDKREKLEVVRAQVLDSADPVNALAAWKALTGKYPSSLAVQSAALRAESTSADPALVQALIARVTALGGSDPNRPTSEVRFARVRAQVHGPHDARTHDEAIATLKSLCLENPGRIDFRDTLVDLLLTDRPAQGIKPDFTAAIDQLVAASAAAPVRAPYTLRLAAILTRQGRSADAAASLSTLALDQSAPLEARLEAVNRLARLNELPSALRGLTAIIGQSATPPADLQVRRAELLIGMMQDREAAEVCRALAAGALTDAKTILGLASALRVLGEAASAESVMAKLDSPSIPPLERALSKGSFHASGTEPRAAVQDFTLATTLDPADARGWIGLARVQMTLGDVPNATAAVKAGLAAARDRTDLEVMLQTLLLDGKADQDADLAPLADALAKRPATAARAESIRALIRLRADGKLDDPRALVDYAVNFAEEPASQLFAARRLLALTPPRVAEATQVLRDAVARFPNDPSVQQEGCRVLLVAGDWANALSAAKGWRALSRSDAACVAVGEAELALGHARLASDAIRHIRLPEKLDSRDSLALSVLNIRARSAAQSATPSSVNSLLAPFLRQAPEVRTQIALPIAASVLPDPASATALFDLIAAAADGGPLEQVALANGWGLASTRFPTAQAEFLRRALSITEPLVQDPATAPLEALESHTVILKSMGSLPAAVQSARRFVDRAPNLPRANLLLAKLLLSTDSDLPLAVSLAARAAEADPNALTPRIVQAQAHLRLAASAASDAAAKAESRAKAATLLQALASSPNAGYLELADIAAIAETLGDAPVAMAAYERLVAAPTPPDQKYRAVALNNLAFLLFERWESKADKNDLVRARSLVDQAVSIVENPGFLDTLGLVASALDDRPASEAAYRRARTLDPKSISSTVGLLSVLAASTEDRARAEAAELLRSLESRPDELTTLSPRRRMQMQKAKASLAR